MLARAGSTSSSAKIERLHTESNFAIDLVIDGYTHTLQVHRRISDDLEQTVAVLPLDPMDNTLVGKLNKNSFAALGDQAQTACNYIAKLLQEKIGAKEIVVLPPGVTLPEYVSAPETYQKCDRLRHANRAQLQEHTAKILHDNAALTNELDAAHIVLCGEKNIVAGMATDKPYNMIYGFLEDHANFSAGKMLEYKEEQVNGMQARFRSGHVHPIIIWNKDTKRISGVIRSVSMGDQWAYLSDETMNQQILALDKFAGNNDEEKKFNRAVFLLAYLMNKACTHGLQNQDTLLILASPTCVPIYVPAGFKLFPRLSDEYTVHMKFEGRRPKLEEIKAAIIKPKAQVSVTQVMGTLTYTSPTLLPAASTAPQPKGPAI